MIDENLDDMWAAPPTYATRLQPQWRDSETLAVQLARAQESLHYLRQTVEADTHRLQVIYERLQGLDARLRAMEEWRSKETDAIAQVMPIVEQYKRWQDRKTFIRGLLNWASAAAIIYLAASGRAQWLHDVLPALARIFGAH